MPPLAIRKLPLKARLQLRISRQRALPPSYKPIQIPMTTPSPIFAARRIASTVLARTQSRSISNLMRPSSTTEPAALSARLEPLLVASGGKWHLTPSGEGLERGFKFKTFAKTWDFMTAVSLQCKINNHHPEWSNVFNITFIRWTTHNPRGLSHKDVDLAIACDAIARDFGELEPESTPSAVKDLADKATAGAGDCCAPKK